MLSDTIGELRESVNGMTLFTVAGNTTIDKLSVMVILMAIGTPVMLQRVSEFCLMTLAAAYVLMSALKPEACLIMVKADSPPGDGMERFLAMALPAILSELVLVRIFMTACTICMGHPPELLIFLTINYLLFMTLYTVYRFVFSNKLKSCISMVELCSGYK
jgi:hypothetical protein